MKHQQGRRPCEAPAWKEDYVMRRQERGHCEASAGEEDPAKPVTCQLLALEAILFGPVEPF